MHDKFFTLTRTGILYYEWPSVCAKRETSKQEMAGQLHRQSNFFKSPMLSMYGCFKTRVF